MVWIRLFRAALWLLVLAGPVACGVLTVQVWGLGHRLDEASRRTVVEELPAATAPVEGFAELFVAGYLSPDGGSHAMLGLLHSTPLGASSDEVWRVGRTVSLGAEQITPGYFVVMVAAELLGRDLHSAEKPSWMPVGIRFFKVGVVETESGWVAVGPPTLVAAPSTGSRPDLLVPRLDGLRDVPGLEEAVSRFLAAYLTGEGELARYVAPGSPLAPVVPPPFASVEVLEAGSVTTADGTRQVVAVVEGRDEVGRSQVLQYGLVTAERDGRWEVVELLPAPSLATTNNN